MKMIVSSDYPRDEFLHFLADILDPGTGEFRLDRFAAALKLCADEEASLADAIARSGPVKPALLFDLLEARYDRLGSITETLTWFMSEPQAAYGGKTPFEVCINGGLEPLRRAQRKILAEKLNNQV